MGGEGGEEDSLPFERSEIWRKWEPLAPFFPPFPQRKTTGDVEPPSVAQIIENTPRFHPICGLSERIWLLLRAKKARVYSAAGVPGLCKPSYFSPALPGAPRNTHRLLSPPAPRAAFPRKGSWEKVGGRRLARRRQVVCRH